MKRVEDTEREAVRAWAPAYENYTFLVVPEGTRIVVDQDVTQDFESDMAEAWPKALAKLEALCEQRGATWPRDRGDLRRKGRSGASHPSSPRRPLPLRAPRPERSAA